MFPCIFKYFTGLDCPGCGLQRSIVLLLDGQLLKSIYMYWATIPVLMMFVYLALHLRFRFARGRKTLIFLFAINGFIIFCHYIYKVSNQL